MRDKPDGAALLRVALDTLRDDVVPAVSEERRLAALMIANAVGIVLRELEAGDGPERAAHGRLAAMYDAPQSGAFDLSWRLARDIRNGAFDPPGPRREMLRTHLMRTTRDRLKEVNPKYLALLEAD